MSLYRLKSGSYHNQKLGVDLEPGGTLETDVDMRREEGYDRWELVRTGAEEDTIENLRARIKILEGRPPEETVTISEESVEKEEPEAPAIEDPPQLHTMQMKDLRAYAAAKGIDLEGLSGKSNLINAIEVALAEVNAE